MTHLTSQLQSYRSYPRPVISHRTQRILYIGSLVLMDGFMLFLAFLLAYWARFELDLLIFNLEVIPSPDFYGRVIVVFIGMWLLLFLLFRLYAWENLLGGVREYALVANASTVATVLVIAVGFIWQDFVVARGWLLLSWVLTFLFVSLGRLALRRLVFWLRHHGYYMTTGLILGVNGEAFALADQLASWKTSGLNVVGFIGDRRGMREQGLEVPPILGDLTTLPDVVESYGVEELVVATSALSAEELLEVFRRFGGQSSVNLRLSSGLFDIITTGLDVTPFGYVPLITVNKVRLSRTEALMKGCMDRMSSILGLILLSPIFLMIAIAVKLDSKGPIIYRRQVLGRGGKPFDAFKFRTMRVNGHELLTSEQWAYLQADHKLKHDPRVTRVGKFLRKYSLDELPQLVNVLRGEMSLIGPRMITTEEKEKYGKWDMNLLTVKPGISGLWQVSGRSDLSYEERVRLDMYYIRNYSIWLDIQLLLRTFVVVLKGKGAY